MGKVAQVIVDELVTDPQPSFTIGCTAARLPYGVMGDCASGLTID